MPSGMSVVPTSPAPTVFMTRAGMSQTGERCSTISSIHSTSKRKAEVGRKAISTARSTVSRIASDAEISGQRRETRWAASFVSSRAATSSDGTCSRIRARWTASGRAIPGSVDRRSSR